MEAPIRASRRLGIFTVVLACAACGGAARSDHTVSMPGKSCLLVAGRPAGSRAVGFAVPEAVDPRHAPVATQGSERMVFGQLYVGLLNLDCSGTITAALADTWTADAGGRVWSFTIADNARFWDGARVDARDVLTAWRWAYERRGRAGAFALIDFDSSVAGNQGLRVVLSAPVEASFFADPVLGVARPTADGEWPAGTGRYLVDALMSRDGELRLASVAPGALPTIIVRAAGTGDLRDVVDDRVDGLVTGDPAVIRYATAGGEYTVVGSAWDRTYVFAGMDVTTPVPRRSDGDISFLEGLATEAVRREARGASQGQWWSGITSCPSISTGTTRDWQRAPTRLRIAYPADDPVARDVSERLVAVGGRGPGQGNGRVPPWLEGGGQTAPLRAAGLTAAEFAKALADGGDAGYVFPLRKVVYAPCVELRGLMDRIPWLRSLDGDFADRVVPLIETRSSLVVRPDLVTASTTWDGTIQLFPGRVSAR